MSRGKRVGRTSMVASAGVLILAAATASFQITGEVPIVKPTASPTAAVGVGLLQQTAGSMPSGPWMLSRPAPPHELEGFATATTVTPGDSVGLKVSTYSPSFSGVVYRMGE